MNSLILKFTALLFLITLNCYSQKATLTFNVDMNATGLLARETPLHIGIRGSIEPLSWIKGIEMTDDDKDGIYSATIDFEPKGEKDLIFKYVLNEVEWEGGENLQTEIKRNAKPYTSNFRYVPRPGNPFKKFIGEWTLKNDRWEQGYGEDKEEIKIPNHYTLCKEVNTDNSLLWIVESTSAKGHIFWNYNHTTEEVQWSSSFYSFRSGSGKGNVQKNGDVIFKVTFEGEPADTYRLYTYKWISDTEYELNSVQYNDKDEPTGSFYGGTFIKIIK